LIINRRRTVT